MDRGLTMGVRIYVKYRCMTCDGTPPIGDIAQAEEHLRQFVGHELAARTTSDYTPDEPEGED